MKDGFKSITIEPFNGYLDFQGPVNPEKPSGNIVLKGDIRLELTKAVKVKSAALKFKGNSRVCHQNSLESIDISTPILPKLKTQLFSSTTSLGPGEVTLPWEIEILNIYPSSVMIKRASISYKIELTISLGLNRSVTAEYPIVLKRHLLPCLEVSPLVQPKLYTKTISTKFHYEINAPRIVCVAQQTMPMAIKLLTIGAQKRVLSIRTQVLQVELYRCSALPKTDADMTKFKSHSLGQKGNGSTPVKKGEANKYAKYTKRTAPAIVHTLDETQPMPTNQPLLIRHPLGEYLTMGLESPLAAIYHQLEITFQFGAKFEDIRAKIPVLITSAAPTQSTTSRQLSNSSGGRNRQHQPMPLPLYPFEKIPVVEPISVMDEMRMNRNASSIRAPTPTPTSNSSDSATVDDDEEEEDVGSYIEIMDDLPRNNTNMGSITENKTNPDDSITSGLLNTTTSLSLSSHSLRRARSAADLTTTPLDHGLTTEKPGTQTLKIPEQPRHHQEHHQRHLTNATVAPPSLPIPNKPTLVTPTTEDTSPHAQSKRLLNNSMERASGMWPRPGTEVPHQWRRRSSSQPYLYTDRMPSNPAKDSKRYNPNLTITPPSIKTLRSLAHPTASNATSAAVTSSKDDSSPLGANDDSSLLGASESSVSFSSSASESASNASSNYELQSRPISPTFSPAPGLPSLIPLRPQEANPVALLEESFILSPGSMASTPGHPLLPDLLSPTRHRLHRASLQYTQGYIYNNKKSNNNNNNNSSSSNNGGDSGLSRASVISTAQSSVLDPDEDMMRMMQAMDVQYRHQMEQKQQQSSLEQHYTYAELPPIPTADVRRRRHTTIYYADDSSNDEDDDNDTFITSGDGMMYDSTCTTAAGQPCVDGFVPPPIAVSPLPPPPLQQQAQEKTDGDEEEQDDENEPVCLCPKHGVIVTNRRL
ncbi:hypothetical protein BCR42DRAFT_413284 [Absidia repens]|uniref:Arrestin C-terminal-like domain-containing protein n=1 Tax=Absidia repens TaxID=90262 RepID=A0A1X2IKX3_9FUNG|nr:hypothetical protein BCR42DRAFT_413284 [Absidia repens]